MLRGLQRIDLANWVTIVSLVINLALMSWGLLAGWAFHWIVLISVATTVTPNIVAVFLVFARIPGLSLHPRHFRFAAVQQTLSFSLVAYLITFTNLIIGRTDQMVISFCLGVAMVGLYQAGYKAADMFGLFSGQMQDSLTPAAARLNAGKDQAGLCDLLMRSTRLMLFMVVPLYGLCAVYLEPLIKILTGIKVLDQQTFWVGQALLLSTFSSLLTDSCSKRVLMMCGWERRLLRASLASAGLNLVASLALVWRLGVLGVALGTMIPTILVGWFWIVPMTAEFLKLSVPALLTEFARGVAWPIVASVLTLLVLVLVFPLEPGAHFVACVWRGAVVMGVLATVGWGFIRAVRKSG
jgi:O-antigen/teichoic acid export membrane protein